MKIAERIVMVLIVLALIGGAVWFYVSVQEKQREVREAVARGDYEIPDAPEEPEVTETSGTSTAPTEEEWRRYYPTLLPVTIGSTTVMASLADSIPERIKGLSDTPYLPEGIVKLFAFGTAGEHSIWMKDMNYPIDIIWVSEDGTIVHHKDNVSPDTYPESFSSPRPAFYVIEANAGFVAKEGLKNGDKVVITLPQE
ncbi:MAG TPA: DUF192 domain-containing protein [Candidatus Paceibacterota bacterium]